MRSYGKVSPRFWTGESGRALRGKPNVQVVALYLMTAPGANMIGLFYLPLVLIVHETGLSETEVTGALDTLSRMDVAHYNRAQEIVWVPEMAKHQIAERLKAGDQQSKGIAKELQPFVRHPFFANFMRRYGEAFCLTDKGLPTPIEPPSVGPKIEEQAPSNSGSGTGSGTGGEPPPRSLQRSEPETPPPEPPRAQTGGSILSAFGSRWQKVEKKFFIRGKFDERDAHDLAESLNEITDPKKRVEAWAEIPPAIDRYMRTSKPFYAGHPFSAFVKDLAALRTEASSGGGSVAAAPIYRTLPPIPAGVAPPPRPRP